MVGRCHSVDGQLLFSDGQLMVSQSVDGQHIDTHRDLAGCADRCGVSEA